MKLCTACRYVGVPVKKIDGSIVVEIGLWLIFLLPGIIYSIWRASTRREACPKCGNSGMIPTDSPMARQILGERVNAAKYGRAAENLAKGPPNRLGRYRVSKAGDDLGELTLTKIKNMVADGALTMEDYYFDGEIGDWIKLESLPALFD